MSPMPRPEDISMQLAYTPAERRQRFNVLLVIADDLGARHLPFYGYERDTMPLLQRRLEGATLFTNCHSPVGWTLPGCASIITGQLPGGHGLYDHNNRFQKPKLGHYLGEDYERVGIANNGNVVSDTIPLEYLESLGFERRPAKWKSFGWDDGFDRYDWIHREDHEKPFVIAREFLESRKGADSPWFLSFHSNLVHDYHMGRDYYLDVGDWIDGEIHPGLRDVRDGPEIWRNPPAGVDWEQEKRELVAKYDSGVRGYDARLDELFRLVDLDSTIVVFVSDHGEGFEPERGRVHHCGRLHGDLTHVPLAIWLPPPLRSHYEVPLREEQQCSTIDVVPTILTLLGDAVAGFPGRFLFDLPPHRRLRGEDRGYLYWNEDCARESYDTCSIEVNSETTYPLKRISVRRNDTTREYSYNLAYDPLEHENLLDVPEVEGEPVSFVVAVNDEEELRNNFLASAVARGGRHEILLVDNSSNSRYESISALYSEAMEKVKNDLVLFVHQDLYLYDGWEQRFFAGLRALEAVDPDWGVIGPVGALGVIPGEKKQLRGHWSDPSGYHFEGPLPQEVESLDEQLLGIRRRNGIEFDAALPGFHCYGIDLSLAAREQGHKSYALDCYAWHKFKDSEGRLVERRERSAKIKRRWGDEFMAEFGPSADYVENKWQKYLPFQTTSWTWGVD